MLLFLLSLGGIPFVAGFWAKLYVFWAAAQAGLYGLVLLGAVLTVVALFYYLLVAKRMYIDAAGARPPDPRRASWPWPWSISALAVVLLGLYPRPLLDATLAVAAKLGLSAVAISVASLRSRSSPILTYTPRTLRLAPPSGLGLLASHHGTSGCQDQGLTETCRCWANKQSRAAPWPAPAVSR